MISFQSRWLRSVSALAALAIGMAAVLSAGATVQSEPFERTWERTDRPVAAGQISRTWIWGPIEPAYETVEPYVESPNGMRAVAYLDKSRMEITNPAGDQGSIWFVTNGLLSTELITGQMQMGDASFEAREPAEVNVAGDSDDPNGPTYATFTGLLNMSPATVGTVYTERLSRDGTVSDDPSLAGRGVTAAVIDDVTNHSIATPFWDFMTSSGIVWQGGAFVTDKLFENPVFGTGRPISEPYWATVRVGGNEQDVLIQCFERRCLTYTPENPDGWQVEAGNVGRHYYVWRYGEEPPVNGGEPIVGDPVSGQQIYSQMCSVCHSITGAQGTGPPLNGLLGKQRSFTNGTSLIADEAYIRESIVDPGALRVVGSQLTMPTIPGLSDQDVEDLVAFIMSLD